MINNFMSEAAPRATKRSAPTDANPKSSKKIRTAPKKSSIIPDQFTNAYWLSIERCNSCKTNDRTCYIKYFVPYGSVENSEHKISACFDCTQSKTACSIANITGRFPTTGGEIIGHVGGKFFFFLLFFSLLNQSSKILNVFQIPRPLKQN